MIKDNPDFIEAGIRLAVPVILADGRIDPHELSYIRVYLSEYISGKQVDSYMYLLESLLQNKEAPQLKTLDAKRKKGFWDDIYMPLPFMDKLKSKDAHVPQLKVEILNAVQEETFCKTLKEKYKPEERLLIAFYLFKLANADFKMSDQEINIIEQICVWMGIDLADCRVMAAMFEDYSGVHYTVLQARPSMSDQDLKDIFRTMVAKHDTSWTQTRDPLIQALAEEKLACVEYAFQCLVKERNFVM